MILPSFDSRRYILPTCLCLTANLLAQKKQEMYPFPGSNIMDMQQQQTLSRLYGIRCDWRQIYQASANGFTAAAFHRYVQGIPNTLTVFKSDNGFVYGVFTAETWDPPEEMKGSSATLDHRCWKPDPKAFLFSLVNARGSLPQSALRLDPQPGEDPYALYCHTSLGPSCGNGRELLLGGTFNHVIALRTLCVRLSNIVGDRVCYGR